ncbi:protein Stu1p [[Candida] anglica]
MAISGDELYRVVASGDDHAILAAVNEFKAFVKKDFVDTTQVPKYMEALCIAVDREELAVSNASFSVIAHLVKRVSMQDYSGKILQSQSFLVLPTILKRFGDPKTSMRSTARRALEAYWFSVDREAENALLDLGLGSRNPQVILESVAWLQHIVTNVSQNFKLDPFVPALVGHLSSEQGLNGDEVSAAIKKLFGGYYSQKQMYLHRHTLLKELSIQRISQRVCDWVMEGITNEDGMPIGGYSGGTTSKVARTTTTTTTPTTTTATPSTASARSSTSTPNVSTTTTIGRASSMQGRTSSSLKSSNTTPATSASSRTSHPINSTTQSHATSDLSGEILKITSKLPTYPLDTSIASENVSSSDNLYDVVTSLLPPFQGKETEFNWTSRERNIIKLRTIVRGNALEQYPEDLVACLRDAAESICKAILSLRTTLSTNGCQLIKEAAMLLRGHFDPLIDSFVPTLSKLCSATKNIASTNANIGLLSIFINCTFQYKLLQRAQVCANEKNHQPRAYSGTWIQIIIQRFHNNSVFLATHGTSTGPELCARTITKLLGDPNPTVRQVAKDTFWCFWGKFPTIAEGMLTKLDTSIVKALERSRPSESVSSGRVTPTAKTLSTRTSKPSIRESIIARNREIREKQKLEASSRPNSADITQPNAPQPFKFNRLNGARRNFSNEEHHYQSGTASSSHKEQARVASAGELGKKPSHSSGVHLPHGQTNPTQRSNQQQSSHNPSSLSQKQQPQSQHFNKQTDPIISFLSSHQTDLKIEGINLLKYAILGDEDLSSDINSLLTSISISSPQLLKPLFNGSEELLSKSFKYFQPEDFIRICCILRGDVVDAKYVDLITSIVPLEHLYESYATILTQATKIGSILNNSDMVMQMIKFKMNIFHTTIEFLDIALEKLPIADEVFSRIIVCLFDMVSILRATKLYDGLCSLLKKMYGINGGIFKSKLEACAESLKEEVDLEIGIGSSDSMEYNSLPQSGDRNFTSYDLTKVLPSSVAVNASPLKEPSDLTMLMPTFNAKNEFSFKNDSPIRNSPKNIDAEPQFDSVDDNIDIDIDDDIEVHKEEVGDKADDPDKMEVEEDTQVEETNAKVMKEMDDGMELEKSGYENVFVDSSESHSRRSDLFAQFNKEQSAELVQGFAQVQIGELEDSVRLDPLQNFIDKVDPLNKVSNKKKPIQIYQDENLQGSPQKVRNYNYSEMNWFNYSVAKAKALDEDSSEISSSIKNFKVLCTKLANGDVKSKDFISLLKYLQDNRTHSVELNEYLDKIGMDVLEDSMWKFFDNDSTMQSAHILLSGFIILKQVLVNRVHLNLAKLWQLLVQFSGSEEVSDDATSEIKLAIGELFDEILVGAFASSDILSTLLTSFHSNTAEYTHNQLVFVLECLVKILSISTIGLLISDSLVMQIDAAIGPLATSDSVLVRRNVVSIYGKLLRANRTLEINQMERSTHKNAMDGILQKLPVPQKKLIEYYSEI